MPDHDPTGKASLRRDLVTAREARGAAENEQSADLAAAAVRLVAPDTRTVCAYVSTDGEPPTTRLLDALHETGHRVLLPVLLPDLDLDWAEWDPVTALVAGRLGLREPTGQRLGTGAVSQAGVVICPGLAGTPAGARLGRGGGSYDRALARTAGDVLRVLLLHDDEVLDDLPTDRHDQPVDVLVTPARTLWCRTS